MSRVFVLLLIVCVPALAPSRARADGDDAAKLADGEILVDVISAKEEPVPHVRMRGVVDAAPEAVWDVVSHCALYHGRLPRIIASEELARDGNKVRCRTTVEVPWPMSDLTATTNAVHTVEPGVWKRAWKLDTGDYEVNEGSWTLTPYDGGRTLVVYEVRTKPKTSVPGFVQEMAQKKGLPDVLKAIRRFSSAPR